MGAAQDLDKPDLAAVTAGLWDNRSNYDASGNVYPSTGGSGTSGAVLKSDQWRISVAGTLGGTAVSVGDVLVALVDTPGSTSSNWMVLQGNVVAFTGDSGSGGLEGLVPAPAAGDSAAGKFLKANGQWVAVSTSNLGSANLTSTDDARTFTLKSGTTATQNLQIVNSAGTVGYYFDGANTLNFGDTTKFVKPTIYLDSTLTDQMHIRRGSSTFFVLNPLNYALNLLGPSGYRTDLYGNGQVYVTGPSAGFFADNTAGQRIYRQDIQSGTDCYVLMASGSTNKTAFYAGYGNYFIDNVAIGDTYTFTEKFKVKGAGSTSATKTALFQNSASTNIFKVLDNGNTILNLPSTVAADGDLFNNGVNLYTDGTSLKARYKNNSGTASDLVISSNIYNTSSTITDDARTVTLKSGGTATQNLQFLNSGGGNLLKLSGNSTIDFGSSANYINSNFYCNPATNTNFNVLRGTDVYIQSDVAAYTTYFRGSSWSKIIVLSHDAGQVSVAGTNAGFFALNNTGTESIIQRLDSNGAYILYKNSANANIFAIDANSAVAGIVGDFGVGAFGPYSARLQVKGSGSTSATTTALFKNSSSVNALKIRDDNYIIQRAINAPIADADLANNEMSAYIDESLNLLIFKVKYSSGAVKTVSLALI